MKVIRSDSTDFVAARTQTIHTAFIQYKQLQYKQQPLNNN